MKSIILTAQDARELDNLGSLTITKPIKPTPPSIEGATITTADGGAEWFLVDRDGKRLGAGDGVADLFAPPVEPGASVFIREPWYKLKKPDGTPSGRIVLAGDCTVSEGQTAYKWASPVSMPEAEARRFARVVAVAPIYNENVAEWAITLEIITKAEAQGEDYHPVFSEADDPENMSDRFTYAGDMSVEDHEKMCAAIDADRARLYEVQNHIIKLAARRLEIKETLALPVTNPPSVNEIALESEDGVLSGELDALSVEEKNLRASLEDAGVPTPTTEEHARELFSHLSAMSASGAPMAHELATSEQILSTYLSAIDAEETPEPTEGGRDPSDEPQGEEPAAVEVEEVGSFTLGKCKYCGREWGVTLEGSKEGGYPTQRTADAAATRLCDCPEAIENRAPIVGVAMAVTVGTCRYCGQIQEVGPHPSQAAADETASEVCNCPDARRERRVFEQTADACERVQRLFGDEAVNLGFKPINDDAIHLLEHVVEMIARGPISSASINVRGQCKAKFSVTSKGKIKVSRSETRSCDLEDGQ